MSENIKWGKHRRYEKGLVESITINNMLDLRQSNGVITVIEEEAEIVRRIFREYLEGYNMHEIAARLVEQRILNPKVAGSIPSRRTICTNGGTGIRARLRIWCPLRACEFDSHFVHHS